jgi:hypothetical protein
MDVRIVLLRAIPTIALMVCLSGQGAKARSGVTFQAYGGIAASYLQGNSTANFSPCVLPHAGIYALIPVEGAFSLKTGLAYEQKGWKGISSLTDTMDNSRWESVFGTRLHTIRIPLQVCYTLRKGRPLSYSFSAGMSYIFFVQGDEEWTLNTYRDERLLFSGTLQSHPVIALIPDDSRFTTTYEGTEYYRFNTAFRAEAGLTWNLRYSMHIFWERGLNSMSARFENATDLHLGYSGISLGINL